MGNNPNAKREYTNQMCSHLHSLIPFVGTGKEPASIPEKAIAINPLNPATSDLAKIYSRLVLVYTNATRSERHILGSESNQQLSNGGILPVCTLHSIHTH
jgi:hypothetical protein